VTECSHAEVRGILSTLPALGMTIGVLLSYVMGIWLHWYQLALAATALPIALAVLLIPLPESPAWLASRGQQAEADEAMKWLDDSFMPGTSLYDGFSKPMEDPGGKRRLSSSDIAHLSARKSSVNIEHLNLNFIIEEKPKSRPSTYNPDSLFG